MKLIQIAIGNNHNFEYNSVDLLHEYGPPFAASTGSTLYSYNRDKQIIRMQAPDGRAVDYNYKSKTKTLNSINFSRGQIKYDYDTNGKLALLTAPGGQKINYDYDGPLLTSVDWDGELNAKIDFKYDNQFRLISETINSTNLVNYKYDKDSLVTQGGALTLSYNGSNTLFKSSTIDSTTSDYAYNEFGELVSAEHKTAGTELYQATYSRDKLGRIKTKTETIAASTIVYDYSYDNHGRLTEVKTNGALTRTYTYDKNDNRTEVNSVNVASYDAQDRLTSYDGITYDYAANGELKSKNNAGNITTYNHDEFGNLTTVVLPTGKTIDYIIDAQNRRIAKKVNGVKTQAFVYRDQLKPIAELDGDGNIISRFVYASNPYIPDYMIREGVNYSFITDQVGSIRLVVNSSTGAIAQRLDYDEFGKINYDSNPGFQPFTFAAGLYDKDTGLVRFGARDYDPNLGRWTAKDPIRFESSQFNLYVYIHNDPINSLDPTGLIDFYGGLDSGSVGALIGSIQGGTAGILGGASGGAASAFLGNSVIGSTAAGISGGLLTGVLIGRPTPSTIEGGIAGLTQGVINKIGEPVKGPCF